MIVTELPSVTAKLLVSPLTEVPSYMTVPFPDAVTLSVYIEGSSIIVTNLFQLSAFLYAFTEPLGTYTVAFKYVFSSKAFS